VEKRTVCPLCNRSVNLLVRETFRAWTLFECLGCGLQFFWPLRHPGASYYREIYVTLHDASRRGYPLGWNHRQFLGDPPHRPPAGQTLLDVGCGPGTFLAAAAGLGYQVLGIDWNPAALEQARALYRLQPDQLFCGTLEAWTAACSDRPVDVVTAFEVLEHLEDPAAFLRTVHGVLAPRGFVALSVPNRERLILRRERSDLPPHHLTRWNAAVLRRALDRAGFQVLQVAEQPVTLVGAIHHLLGGFRLPEIWQGLRAQAAARVQGAPGALGGLRGVNGLLRGLAWLVLGGPALLLVGYGTLARKPGWMLYVLAQRRT